MIVARVTPIAVSGRVPGANLGATRLDVEANEWTVSRDDFVREVAGWLTLYPAGRTRRPDLSVRVWRIDADLFVILGDSAVVARLRAELPRTWTRAELAESADVIAARARERWPDTRPREVVVDPETGQETRTGRRLGHRMSVPAGPLGVGLRRIFGAISDAGVPVDPDRVPR